MSAEEFTGFAADSGREAEKRKRRVIRHGPRYAYEEHLSPEGIALIQQDAEKMYEQIVREKLGSVFYIASSNVDRAQKTKDHLEAHLRTLVAADEEHRDEIEFVDATDVEKMASIQGNTSKRWILFNVADIPEIGIAKGVNQVGNVWDDIQSELRELALDKDAMEKEVHNLLSKIQIAWPQELPQLFADIREKTGAEMTDDEMRELFSPERYIAAGTTPEDEAIEQLTALHNQAKRVESKFPKQEVHSLTIGHAPVIDYVAMALLGYDSINLETWKTYGGIRNFLEPMVVEFDESGDLVEVSLPDRKITNSKKISIVGIIDKLREQAVARRKAWADFSR